MTLNIVMVEPEIPQNTGNVARTCAATGARLHLVGKMGFTPDDKKLKRAGLDYWYLLDITYYDTMEEFFELYKVASKHLRNRFPEIKIGGYGGCGFYEITRENYKFQTFVTWFTEFLAFVKENECPLDFYTWHIYIQNPH